jgi:hypothetical protein
MQETQVLPNTVSQQGKISPSATWLEQYPSNFWHYTAKRSNNPEDVHIQGDQVHLKITIQKVTSNVQRVPRQSPDTY